MTENPLLTYLSQDRLTALAVGQVLPDRAHGAALFADIAGFTPLTEQLTQQLGARRGIEELACRINAVYDALIGAIEHYGGSVISFAGDAMTCWFDDGRASPEGMVPNCQPALQPSSARAVAAAFAMQTAMQGFPGLGVKVAVASGPVRRFAVGDPAIQQLDTLAGATLTRLATAEHLAHTGEVVVDAATMAALGAAAQDAAWTHQADGRFAVVRALVSPALGAPATPAPLLPPARTPAPDELRPWVLGTVYEREHKGLGAFLTELRPAIPLFLGFDGIDYDGDEAAGEKLDAFTRRVQALVGCYGGALLELTVGDKGNYFYANFGAVVSHEDDARRAIVAALNLLALGREFPFLRELRMGLSSGTLRVGAYGGTSRRGYGALGDDVNLAARLMTSAAAGEILVSGRVYNATAATFSFEPRQPLAMKGKAEPLPVFAVAGKKRHRATRLLEPSYRLPMIGRQAELCLVAEKLALASQGHGQIIGITAEAGMGKSRLVAEAIRLAQQTGFAGYGGVCESSGTNTAYLAWKPIWQAFFDVDPMLPVRRQLRGIEVELEERAPGRMQALPLLTTLLDIPIEDNDFTAALAPKQRKSALEALLEDCLRSAAQEEPILFVLEDVHWIDPLSHDLLERLARASAKLPVCIVLAYRPFEIAALQAPRVEGLAYFTEIPLPELTAPGAEQLIRAKLAQFYPERGGGLPRALADRLTAKAEGNPFFIEELLNYLRDRDISPYDEQALTSLELPTSLHTLVLSRMDQLTESQRVTLKVASIIGRLFPFAWLYGYYPALGRPDGVRANLQELVALELTQLDTPEPELAYLFKHIITQEAAYESLTYATRAQLHEQLAHFLEAQDADKHLNLLAFHYGHSENVAKKRHYLRKAGEAAQAVYANAAALDYYERLLPLVTEPGEQIDLHLRRGALLAVLGSLDEAEAACRRGLVLAERTADAYAIPRCQRALGALCCDCGDYTAALRWLEQARDGWQALGEQVELADTLTEIGEVFYRMGDYATARQIVAQGLAIARTAQDRAVMAHALNNLGLVVLYQGDYAAAQQLLEECLGLSREMRHKPRTALALNNLGLTAIYRGDHGQARALYEEALALFHEMGDKQDIPLALINLGHVAFAQGDFVAAWQLYAESLTLHREIGDRNGTVYSLIGLAGAAAATGQDMPRAAQLAGAAEAGRAAIGATLEPLECGIYERAVATAKAALGGRAFNAAFAEGQVTALDEAAELALAGNQRAG